MSRDRELRARHEVALADARAREGFSPSAPFMSTMAPKRQPKTFFIAVSLELSRPYFFSALSVNVKCVKSEEPASVFVMALFWFSPQSQ